MLNRSSRTSAWSAWTRLTRVAVVAAVALAATLSNARAADEAASASLADTTKPAALLKEFVVTGSRYAREMYRSPQSLSLISLRSLRQQLPVVPGDALALVPGVASSKDSPWAQQPVLRGMSGQRVLVLVDGSPMNNARGRGPQPSLIGSEQIERIEIVRGPASVAYGSDALGGVVNIITREAGEGAAPALNGAASIGGSSVDQQRNAYLELVPRVGNFSAFLSSGIRKADDFDSPRGKVEDSAFEAYDALFNMRYDFTEKTALKGGLQMYRGTDIGIPGLTVDSPAFSQKFRYDNYDRDFAHLTLDHGYNNSWLAGTRVRGYWQQEQRNFHSDIRISMGPTLGLLQDKDRFFDLETWGAQLQATSIKTEQYQFTSGIDFARDLPAGTNEELGTWIDGNGNPRPGPGPPGQPSTFTETTMSIPEGTFDSYAGFMQSEWFVHPQLTLSAGGRVTQYRYRTDAGISDPDTSSAPGAQPSMFEALSVDNSAVSGSFGLVYEPVRDFYLTANVANGFRQPNAQDLFFDGPASVGTVKGNVDLNPEKSISYDVGMRWGPGDLAFAGSLFYSTYEDLIDAVLVGRSQGSNVFQYFNIAKARIWGGEAETQWQFLPQWRARAAVSGAIGDITSPDAIMKLFGIDSDKAALPSVPPFAGNLGLRWTDASKRFWVEPSARFSWRYNRLPLSPPGLEEFVVAKKEWIVADLFAGAAIPSGQRIVIGVRNIADTTYQPALSSLLEPGLSFVGSLSTSF
jgi:hemoglobin/transferrin/lactoferrin receptor protein